MTTDTITLPIAPEHFWMGAAIVGLLALSALIYWVLEVTGRDYRRPTWEDIPESWRGVAILLGLLWLGLFGLTVVAAYAGVWQMIHPKGESGGAASGLGFGALLAAMLGAPFVIWGTWLKHRTVTFQKEGHITDRINKAVEMLGAEKTVKKLKKDKSGSVEVTVPNIEVRIGAILSLERIAQDSTAYDKGRDHVRVMEILCAYVRENSNARKPVDFTEHEWKPLADGASEEAREKHLAERKRRFGSMFFESLAWKWAQALPKPRADVDQALKVLGRRTAEQRKVEAAWPNPPAEDTIWPFDEGFEGLPEKEDGEATTRAEIDAFMTRLATWKQTLANYGGYRINLRGANLQGADLSRAVLSGADLDGARLEGAKFIEAQLIGARFGRARMEGASFAKARLDGAGLEAARMEGANLSGTVLMGAYLRRAKMEGSSLRKAELAGANLSRAFIASTDLSRAKLRGANLAVASMESASIRATTIDDATDFTRSSFREAKVKFDQPHRVSLSRTQADSLFADATLLLPDGIPPPAHWPTWKMDWPSFDKEWVKWQANPAGYAPPQNPEGGAG